MNRSEKATADDERISGRPTRRFIAAMTDLLESLERSPTHCEACGTGVARTVITGRRTLAVCRTCCDKAATPIARRQLQVDAARRR